MRAKTEVIKSIDQLKAYDSLIYDAETLAVDTETDGLGRHAIAIGVSLAPSSDMGIYIPLLVYSVDRGLFNPWSVDNYQYVLDFLHKNFYKSARLIGHNVPFDVKVLENSLGVNLLAQFKCDTALLHHTLNENPPHGLKPLATALLDPNAANPQKDLELSVKANGGSWKAADKEFFKGDVDILGEYACWDVIYTMGLYDKLWPELSQDAKLLNLWNTEVWPLLPITYELNTTGFDVDLDYFNKLRVDMEATIESIDDEIYAQIETKVKDYEMKNILDKSVISRRSRIGKALLANGWDGNEESIPKYHDLIYITFCKDKKVKHAFNLASNNDKAYLLFNVLGLPVQETNDDGRPKVTAAIINKLEEEYAESSPILKLIMKRNKETKLLGTYVDSVLANHENGRIYTSFNQTGTTGGRYSSSKPINFQNLPRDDSRIKAGFVAPKGYKIVGIDYSTLEPRCFSVVANDVGLKEIYWKDLDFYSKLYIDTFNATQYSADPKDDNFLKKLDGDKRQFFKQIALSVPYGASPWRLAQILNIEPEEAEKIVNSYLKAYPNLAKWMRTTEILGRKQGYIESIVGRRRRCPLVKKLWDDHKLKNFDRRTIKRIFKKGMYGYEDPVKLYLAARTENNNIKNFQIQSLAASIVNEAMIEFTKRRGTLDAKIVSTVHDEIILVVKDEQVDEAAKLLQDCMEHNRITDMLDVKMIAEPVIGSNLAEAK